MTLNLLNLNAGWLMGEGDPCKAWVPIPSTYTKEFIQPKMSLNNKGISYLEREREGRIREGEGKREGQASGLAGQQAVIF